MFGVIIRESRLGRSEDVEAVEADDEVRPNLNGPVLEGVEAMVMSLSSERLNVIECVPLCTVLCVC